MTILAIDQGTTSTKAFLLHDDGRFEHVANRTHNTFHPQPGWVEHDAEELARNVEFLIAAALSRSDAIHGVALANQGETVVAWDSESKRPLANAIVWQDQRTQSELDQWQETKKELVCARSGLPLDAYFSASKIAWLLRQQPVADAHKAGRLRIGTSDSFFIDRLTGTYATDVTTASRTSLFSMKSCTWEPSLCEAFGVPIELLAPIYSSAHEFGHILRAGRQIPLVACLVDQQAAMFGHGCRKAGDMKMTFGTGAFALALTGDILANPPQGFVSTIAWQFKNTKPVYAVEGGDYSAATAVDWSIRLGLAKSVADFDIDTSECAIDRGLVFISALAGLAAPHWDRGATGTFLGLQQDTDASLIRLAVLEGIAFRAAEIIDGMTPDDNAFLSIDGGVSQNNVFSQFLADVLGRNVNVSETADLTALGAAQFGFCALNQSPPSAMVRTKSFAPRKPPEDMKRLRVRFEQAIAISRSWPRNL